MSATDLDVFDTTLQRTHSWLKDLEETAHLGAQLPMLIRGFYYEGWDPAGKPLKARHREQFLDRIRQHFRDDATVDAELVAAAVFTVLASRVTEGEIEDVIHVLPSEIRDLWPAEAVSLPRG
jgi:uncharacterized protein (DUF2267 family)